MQPYLLLFILSLCLASCTPRSRHLAALNRLESVMAQNPDSAWTVLQGMDLENDDYAEMLQYYAHRGEGNTKPGIIRRRSSVSSVRRRLPSDSIASTPWG